MAIGLIPESAWGFILEIQNQAYKEISPEDINVLKSKWNCSPQTCFVYTGQSGKVLAYLLAHPWASDIPPKLNEHISKTASSTLFLHDLAIADEGRSKGLGTELVKHLINKATSLGYKKILLVAVQGSTGFWTKFGFKKQANKDICLGYGEDSQLMVLKLRA